MWDLILRTVLFNIQWFDAWLLAQKMVVAFLRDDANRLVLRLKLERDGSPLAAALRLAPTSPFKLRWGTVVAATHDLLAMKLALVASMDTALFPTGSGECKKVVESVCSASFLGRRPKQSGSWVGIWRWSASG